MRAFDKNKQIITPDINTFDEFFEILQVPGNDVNEKYGTWLLHQENLKNSNKKFSPISNSTTANHSDSYTNLFSDENCLKQMLTDPFDLADMTSFYKCHEPNYNKINVSRNTYCNNYNSQLNMSTSDLNTSNFFETLSSSACPVDNFENSTNNRNKVMNDIEFTDKKSNQTDQQPRKRRPYSKNIHKPPISYAAIIHQALESSQLKMMTLNEIYNWILTNYPYFTSGSKSWKNSIRHNLSLMEQFVKVPKPPNIRGKGGYWKLLESKSSDSCGDKNNFFLYNSENFNNLNENSTFTDKFFEKNNKTNYSYTEDIDQNFFNSHPQSRNDLNSNNSRYKNFF